LSIALIERSPQLGEGSSGRLEGWFHAGALYSAQADGQTFMTCVKTVERLINWYRKDRMFPFRENCNFDLILNRDPAAKQRHVPVTVEPKNSASPWFLAESAIYYALRQQLEGGKTNADVTQWEQQSQKISARIHEAYWEWDWAKQGPLAQAPPARHVLESSSSPLEGGEDPFERDIPHKSSPPSIREMLQRYEQFQAPADADVIKIDERYKIYSSRDAVMDTCQILWDLARSAAENGVEFITDTEIQEFNVPQYGDVSVTGLVGCQMVEDPNAPGGSRERKLHLLARQYIFALGSGFNDNFLREELGLRLHVETNMSVMAVIHPPLMDRNFVRMDYYPKNHFNHILRSLGTAAEDDSVLSYSMIANSAFDTRESELKKIAQSIEGLLQTARKYFPDTFYHDAAGNRRHIVWYQCNKTEFLSDDERKRNYLYWYEPEFGETEIDLEPNDPMLALLEGKPKSISRLLSKMTHLILSTQIQQSSGHKRSIESLKERRDVYVKRALASGKPKNYLCVLPGKFSFFPLLAHQVYLEMESRGLYLTAPNGSPPLRTDEPVVAKPHPVVLLKNSQNRRMG
jgi:hypothetical protein